MIHTLQFLFGILKTKGTIMNISKKDFQIMVENTFWFKVKSVQILAQKIVEWKS